MELNMAPCPDCGKEGCEEYQIDLELKAFRRDMLELNADSEECEDMGLLKTIDAWAAWYRGETEWHGLQLPPLIR